MAKGAREKIQARIDGGHRSLLHDDQEQENQSGQNFVDEIRPTARKHVEYKETKLK